MLAMTEPIDRNGKLDQIRCLQLRRGDVARQKREAFLFQASRGRRSATVPWRCEDRICNWSEQIAEQRFARRHVGVLKRTRTALSKLTLASRLLVIHMRVTVLVNCNVRGTFRHQLTQACGSFTRNRFGNDRQIKGDVVLPEEIEQVEEPRIFPTHIIVAEEESYWSSGLIQLLSHRIEPVRKISGHNQCCPRGLLSAAPWRPSSPR